MLIALVFKKKLKKFLIKIRFNVISFSLFYLYHAESKIHFSRGVGEGGAGRKAFFLCISYLLSYFLSVKM